MPQQMLYTGCHGDDIGDQEGEPFCLGAQVKMPTKIYPLKGRKFSFISIMTRKLYLHIIGGMRHVLHKITHSFPSFSKYF